ncbi:hypothetical protein C6499_00930 [Candidatus Poribacteria bacterium]|nr:MAG: hypothetical protein C6499_00930 [Candidatus Poribacteria bacterium]
MLEKNFSFNYPQEETLYLPPQAIARFGKSRVTNTQISPDGNVIAVASRIGVWLYDVHTYRFLSLIGINETGILSKIAFSPDSRRIATADWDGITKLWDIETGANLSTFIHTDYVTSVTFSSNGKYLATGSRDGSAKLWDVNAETELLTIKHEDYVIKVLFSPDNQHIVTGSWDGTAALWNFPDQKHLTTFFHERQKKSVTFSSGNTETFNEGGIKDIAFSPDGRYFATRGKHPDRSTRLWKVKTGKQIWAIFYETLVPTLVFSPDGKHIATANQEGHINLWDVETGKSCLTVAHNKPVNSLVFSVDGSFLLTGSADGIVNVWCVKSGKNIASLTELGFVSTFQYLPNGDFLIETDASVEIWSIHEQCMATLPHPMDNWGWHHVNFSPEGHVLAGMDQNSTITLWDVGTGEPLRTLKRFHGRQMELAFSDEGGCVGLTATENTVTLWDAERIINFTLGHDVTAATVSSNGRFVATGSRDGNIKLWQVETQQCAQTLSGHIAQINAITFSPDGTLLISGGGDNWETQKGEDGTVYFFLSSDGVVDTSAKVWEVATGKNIATLESSWMVRGIAFSPDGKCLATGTTKTVTLWCPKTWQPLATLDTVIFESFTFSPDGSRLVIGGTWPEQRIQVWDVETRELIVEFSGHKSDVESLAFSPDSRLLASGGFDGVIYLWDMTPYL